MQESRRQPSWGGAIGWLSQPKRIRNLTCLDSHSLTQQFCSSLHLEGGKCSFVLFSAAQPFYDPSLPMDMVHLSPLGLASQNGCIFRDKGKETNAISAFSKLPINGFTCSSYGPNWNSNWPLWPPLIIQGVVISRGLIHLFTWVLADCRIITGNSS